MNYRGRDESPLYAMHFKYISKKMVNGVWRYIYPQADGKAALTTADLTRGASNGTTGEIRKQATTTNSVPKNSTQRTSLEGTRRLYEHVHKEKLKTEKGYKGSAQEGADKLAIQTMKNKEKYYDDNYTVKGRVKKAGAAISNTASNAGKKASTSVSSLKKTGTNTYKVVRNKISSHVNAPLISEGKTTHETKVLKPGETVPKTDYQKRQEAKAKFKKKLGIRDGKTTHETKIVKERVIGSSTKKRK